MFRLLQVRQGRLRQQERACNDISGRSSDRRSSEPRALTLFIRSYAFIDVFSVFVNAIADALLMTMSILRDTRL